MITARLSNQNSVGIGQFTILTFIRPPSKKKNYIFERRIKERNSQTTAFLGSAKKCSLKNGRFFGQKLMSSLSLFRRRHNFAW